MRLLPAVLALTVLATALDSAQAGFLNRRSQGEAEYAVAESRFGNGTVSGPVRAGRTGYEVRLPSGRWTACRRSCSETLRVETVDLWENHGGLVGAGAVQNECGIFGCLDVRFPY